MTDHPLLDWTVQRNPEDTEVHVTPNHDLKPHTLDVQCACRDLANETLEQAG